MGAGVARRMDELKALRSLARAMGVHTRYIERPGQARHRSAGDAGARLRRAGRPGRAAGRCRRRAAGTPGDHEARGSCRPSWSPGTGPSPRSRSPLTAPSRHSCTLEDGLVVPLERSRAGFRATQALPCGYHRLTVEVSGRSETSTVIAAPRRGVAPAGGASELGSRNPSGRPPLGAEPIPRRPPGPRVPLPLGRRAGRRPGHGPPPGADLQHPVAGAQSVLAGEPALLVRADPRPGRGPSRRRLPPPHLDVTRGDAEVRAALAGHPAPPPSELDEELVRYARFRGAQVRLGRNWRDWPPAARAGTLTPDQVDPEEERFHLVAQTLARRQLHDLRQRLDHDGFRLGLDLAVGGHPDGYDPWSRQTLFCDGMSVGAPPDQGFPSGQDWGFSPVLPEASRREGHRYLAASIAHQAGLAGVLRVDHIMAWTRLYWIPHGFGLARRDLCFVSRRGAVRRAHPGVEPPPVRGGRARTWAPCLARSSRRCRVTGSGGCTSRCSRPRTAPTSRRRPRRTWPSSAATTRRRSRVGSRATTLPTGCAMASWPSREFRQWPRNDRRPSRWLAAHLGSTVEDPRAFLSCAAGVARPVEQPAGGSLARGPLARGGGREPPRHPLVRASQLAAPDAAPARRDLHRPRGGRAAPPPRSRPAVRLIEQRTTETRRTTEAARKLQESTAVIF